MVQNCPLEVILGRLQGLDGIFHLFPALALLVEIIATTALDALYVKALADRQESRIGGLEMLRYE